ncbi:MAG: hypothetical protein JXR76_11330 [Deltaproteobacteria bacterium]|nr:hypothetical protein [Deltaproteobacteria bacterium]
MSTDSDTASVRNRNDFSSKTRELIAKKSGYICAFPDCGWLTIAGSDSRSSEITDIGVAAHITAAAPGGPRYDSIISSEERSSERNGIWLCQNHAKHVDDNEKEYTADTLRRWKTQHEASIFHRVKTGEELAPYGITRVSFKNVGAFKEEYSFRLGQHNILLGGNESGKTTICQIIASFSGTVHWNKFNERFHFIERAATYPYIEVSRRTRTKADSVRLTAVPTEEEENSASARLHVEVNSLPSMGWSKTLVRVLHLNEQFYKRSGDLNDAWPECVAYLAEVLDTPEDLMWDSIRQEFFQTSTFGFKFKRTSHRELEIKVPKNNRDFYLPQALISGGESTLAFLEIVLKVIQLHSDDYWLLIIDSGFFVKLDVRNQEALFDTLRQASDVNVQTIFCLHAEKDANALKDANQSSWVNAQHFGKLTLHSFL